MTEYAARVFACNGLAKDAHGDTHGLQGRLKAMHGPRVKRKGSLGQFPGIQRI